MSVSLTPAEPKTTLGFTVDYLLKTPGTFVTDSVVLSGTLWNLVLKCTYNAKAGLVGSVNYLGEGSVRASFHVSIIHKGIEKYFTVGKSVLMLKNGFFSFNEWRSSELASHGIVSLEPVALEEFVNEPFSIKVVITVIGEMTQSVSFSLLGGTDTPPLASSVVVPSNKSFSLLENVVQKIFNDETSDLVFITSTGEKLKVHKFIVCARSEVLKDILSNQEEGVPNDEIHITNVEPAVVKTFVRCLYSDRCTLATNEEFAQCDQLFMMAHKYQVRDLYSHCERYRASHLYISNVVSSLLLAETYLSTYLRNAAIDFIAVHFKQVLNTHKDFFSRVPTAAFREIAVKIAK